MCVQMTVRDRVSPHIKPGDISITESYAVLFIYDRLWLSDVHSWPNTCKKATELYLQKPKKGLLKM